MFYEGGFFLLTRLSQLPFFYHCRFRSSLNIATSLQKISLFFRDLSLINNLWLQSYSFVSKEGVLSKASLPKSVWKKNVSVLSAIRRKKPLNPSSVAAATTKNSFTLNLQSPFLNSLSLRPTKLRLVKFALNSTKSPFRVFNSDFRQTLRRWRRRRRKVWFRWSSSRDKSSKLFLNPNDKSRKLSLLLQKLQTVNLFKNLIIYPSFIDHSKKIQPFKTGPRRIHLRRYKHRTPFRESPKNIHLSYTLSSNSFSGTRRRQKTNLFRIFANSLSSNPNPRFTNPHFFPNKSIRDIRSTLARLVLTRFSYHSSLVSLNSLTHSLFLQTRFRLSRIQYTPFPNLHSPEPILWDNFSPNATSKLLNRLTRKLTSKRFFKREVKLRWRLGAINFRRTRRSRILRKRRQFNSALKSYYFSLKLPLQLKATLGSVEPKTQNQKSPFSVKLTQLHLKKKKLHTYFDTSSPKQLKNLVKWQAFFTVLSQNLTEKVSTLNTKGFLLHPLPIVQVLKRLVSRVMRHYPNLLTLTSPQQFDNPTNLTFNNSNFRNPSISRFPFWQTSNSPIGLNLPSLLPSLLDRKITKVKVVTNKSTTPYLIIPRFRSWPYGLNTSRFPFKRLKKFRKIADKVSRLNNVFKVNRTRKSPVPMRTPWSVFKRFVSKRRAVKIRRWTNKMKYRRRKIWRVHRLVHYKSLFYSTHRVGFNLRDFKSSNSSLYDVVFFTQYQATFLEKSFQLPRLSFKLQFSTSSKRYNPSYSNYLEKAYTFLLPKFSTSFNRSPFFLIQFMSILKSLPHVRIAKRKKYFYTQPYDFVDYKRLKKTVFNRLITQRRRFQKAYRPFRHQRKYRYDTSWQLPSFYGSAPVQDFSSTLSNPTTIWSAKREYPIWYNTYRRFFFYENGSPHELPRFIRKTRFKPGYPRIWREERVVIKDYLKLTHRYQYRLTTKLQNMYYPTRTPQKVKHKTDLKLSHALILTRLATDQWTADYLLDSKTVYLNGNLATNGYVHLFMNDLLQLMLNVRFYLTYRWLKSLSIRRFNAWLRRYYKTYRIKRQMFKDFTFRVLPDSVMNLQNSWYDVPRHFEVDYFTLSAFVLTKNYHSDLSHAYPIEFFDLYVLNMYNWKYLT